MLNRDFSHAAHGSCLDDKYTIELLDTLSDTHNRTIRHIIRHIIRQTQSNNQTSDTHNRTIRHQTHTQSDYWTHNQTHTIEQSDINVIQ